MKKMIDELWDGEISPQDTLISDNQKGIQYILDNTDKDYALKILNGNAASMLGVVLPPDGDLRND